MYSPTLAPGQLAALAGLRALGDLDLELLGVREVVRGHAEAAGGDLLDRRAAPVAVSLARVAARVLAALARVRAAADPVHRDRERLVRLGRERAEAHRPGREALHDLGRGLDLVERHRRALLPHPQQAADQAVLGVLLVHPLGERGVVHAAVAVARGRRAGGSRSSPGPTCGARRRGARRRRRPAAGAPRAPRAGARARRGRRASGRARPGRRGRGVRAPPSRAPPCRRRRSTTRCR